jgi:pimeloyl-ACP methyl ester carboxylesterase
MAAGAALGGGALALANWALLLDDLPPTLPGAMHDWTWRGWRVRYTTLGQGPPLVLLHGLHAAASSFELRNVFEPLSRRHAVYAVDLLGFGKSQRPAVPYSAALYRDLLGDFLDEVVGRPAVVVTSSLSAAYAVAVARSAPMLVERLVLISPTGTTSTGPIGRLAGRLLALPLVGTAGFNLLASRASIEWFLRRVYADPALVDEVVMGQQWATAHQPNARLAPAAFVAGRLDLPLGEGRTPIQAPILVLRGSVPGLGEGATDAELLGLGPAVTIRTIDGAGQLPHDEQPDTVVEIVEGWLG